MFIRQTRTRNKATGEGYFTFRLVRTERIGGKVRQITLLNLGRNFSVHQEDWPVLCNRIEQLLHPQQWLVDINVPDKVEEVAQRYYGRLVARALPINALNADAATSAIADITALADASKHPENFSASDYHEVDLNSLQFTQPRSVGVEHCALHALKQIGLIDQLDNLGFTAPMRASIIGNLIGRMAAPASELATWHWLQRRSSLGELLDIDFEGMSHMNLYRASDLLMKHRSLIENQVYSAIQSLYDLDETVTLFDLTNTYFEGEVSGNSKAKFGRSKEKRTDCRLLTLGLVLNGSGIVRRSQTFAGNVVEGTTLQGMLTQLSAPLGALVIMDAGIATEENLRWLAENKYRYLVVRRGGVKQFDESKAVVIETASGDPLRLQKELSEDGKEVFLYCHSEGREAKEIAMNNRFGLTFEAGLQKISDGLSRKGTTKNFTKLAERIGRLKEKSHGASQHYTINMEADTSGKLMKSLTWQKVLVKGTSATHPGIYCLRTNELCWDEEKMWRTYSTLTDLESVFRSLKGELGLRPVFHSKEDRSDGHLFLTVLAYQCVQVLRLKLKKADINLSWASLRNILSSQQRITISQSRRDGCTIHIRKSTEAEADAKKIYNALGISSSPGGTKKLIV
jgi:transposase